MNLVEKMKRELWRRFGNSRFPAEWDGTIHGGGKLSQRYWEYFIAIDMLKLKNDSILLDIGGFSKDTNNCFFTKLVSKYLKKVYIIDPNGRGATEKIAVISKPANRKTLQTIIAKYKITHISCISVLEHVEPKDAVEIITGINETFSGPIVFTYEFHAARCFFEHQLTAKTTHQIFKHFTNFYPTEFQRSPVYAEDGYDLCMPRWCPVAIKFVPNL